MNDSTHEGVSPPAGTPQTILIAEDESGLLALVVAALSQAGYRTLAAEDGAQALELARRSPSRIDLLLSDVMMPGLSGPEMASRLLELRPDTRVLFMTGSDPEVLREMRIPFAVLYKPFAIPELLGAVAGALAQQLTSQDDSPI